jgi:hypothetical protein
MISLAVTLALLGAAPSGDTPMTVAMVEHRLAEIGPTATVRELDGAGRWEQVLNRIQSGDARWIALVHQLAQGADASTSGALTAALAEALPKSPRAVLNALNLKGLAPISPDRVCTAPFQDGAAGDVSAYKAASLKALAGLSDSRLSPVRDACILRLQRL